MSNYSVYVWLNGQSDPIVVNDVEKDTALETVTAVADGPDGMLTAHLPDGWALCNRQLLPGSADRSVQ